MSNNDKQQNLSYKLLPPQDTNFWPFFRASNYRVLYPELQYQVCKSPQKIKEEEEYQVCSKIWNLQIKKWNQNFF